MSTGYPPLGGPLAKHCIRCGTPLPLTVVTCVNCGTYNPIAQPGIASGPGQVQWGGAQPQPQGPFGIGQYSRSQWEQSTISPPQNNQWGQPQMVPQNITSGIPSTPPANFYTKPGLNPPSNVNGYDVTTPQNAYASAVTPSREGYTSAALNGYIPIGLHQPPQQKQGPKVGLIVGIILLVMILIGGTFAGYTYFKYYNQTGSALHVTPKVLLTPSTAPLFSDTFANNRTAWDLTSYVGKFSVKVGGGSMVLEDDQNKLLWEVLPGKIFTDFRLDVNATLTKGDMTNGYGLLIRTFIQGNNLSSYYRFELYGDGTYAVFKGYMDASGTMQSKIVKGYTSNAAIAKAGQVNHITVIAKGQVLSLLVNGQAVTTYTDDSYNSGSIALFVSNLPELARGAQATFTNLAIYPVPK